MLTNKYVIPFTVFIIKFLSAKKTLLFSLMTYNIIEREKRKERKRDRKTLTYTA
jgi:hypothetical protein